MSLPILINKSVHKENFCFRIKLFVQEISMWNIILSYTNIIMNVSLSHMILLCCAKPSKKITSGCSVVINLNYMDVAENVINTEIKFLINKTEMI
jgi:hypothetical protein